MQKEGNGSSAVHTYTQADHPQGVGQAPTGGDDLVAAHFVAGAHNASPTVEVSPGVWGDGFCKSG